jgi:hypothetical protein
MAPAAWKVVGQKGEEFGEAGWVLEAKEERPPQAVARRRPSASQDGKKQVLGPTW